MRRGLLRGVILELTTFNWLLSLPELNFRNSPIHVQLP